MRKASRKFSLGIKIATILSCLALVSIGFASWWIVKMPDPVEKSGAFEVYKVDSKDVKIENVAFTNIAGTDPATPSSNIIFGKKSGVTETWLLADDDVKVENLTATLTFDVAVYDSYVEDGENTLSTTSKINDFVGSVDFDLETTAGVDALQNAIAKGYITTPTVSYSYTVGDQEYKGEANYANGKATLSIPMTGAAKNKVTVTVTFNFEWGEFFRVTGEDSQPQNLNPYEFYNSKEYSEETAEGSGTTWAAQAETVLGEIYKLNGGAYNITLTTKSK